ncbi:MAG: TGS domain-containing protein [Anaerolineales bacterium]|jgi:ribosome-interacting GTPase 1
MPTNLPPQYFEVEKRYRAAKETSEKIECLEEMLTIIPKHKGTDRLRGDLRRKLSKLKTSAQVRKGGSRRVDAYSISKEGPGQVVVAGAANTGKSSLVATLTNAEPEVSPSPHSTWKPTPGMMPVEDIQIQLIDTPPLDRDFAEPGLIDLIRRADLVLLMVDIQAHPIQQLEQALDLLLEHRIAPQHMQDSYQDRPRMTFPPFLLIVNKNDDDQSDQDVEVLQELIEGDWPLVAVSTETARNLESLKRAVFDRLDIVRVYSKAPGKDPDLGVPYVLQKGNTVSDLAAKVHKDFVENLKAARVWGSTAFEGQMVARDYVLHDGDIIELRT